MVKRLITLTLFVIVLFLVSGTTGCALITPFIGTPIAGEQGVRFKFVTGEPPRDKIYEGEEFFVSLDLYNSMPDDVYTTIRVTDLVGGGLQGGILGKIATREKVKIPAATYGTEGLMEGYENVIFPQTGKGYKYGNIPPKGTETIFKVDIESKYTVKLNPTICVKKKRAELGGISCPDEETLTGNRVSGTAKAITGFKGQTSPIVITSIKKIARHIRGNDINVELSLDFENKGSGDVLADKNGKKIITLKNVGIYKGENLFKCENKFSLKDKKKTVRCTIKLELKDSEFSSYPLDIIYKYDYELSGNTGKIPIVDVEGEEPTRYDDSGMGYDEEVPAAEDRLSQQEGEECNIVAWDCDIGLKCDIEYGETWGVCVKERVGPPAPPGTYDPYAEDPDLFGDF